MTRSVVPPTLVPPTRWPKAGIAARPEMPTFNQTGQVIGFRALSDRDVIGNHREVADSVLALIDTVAGDRLVELAADIVGQHHAGGVGVFPLGTLAIRDQNKRRGASDP